MDVDTGGKLEHFEINVKQFKRQEYPLYSEEERIENSLFGQMLSKNKT